MCHLLKAPWRLLPATGTYEYVPPHDTPQCKEKCAMLMRRWYVYIVLMLIKEEMLPTQTHHLRGSLPHVYSLHACTNQSQVNIHTHSPKYPCVCASDCCLEKGKEEDKSRILYTPHHLFNQAMTINRTNNYGVYAIETRSPYLPYLPN